LLTPLEAGRIAHGSDEGGAAHLGQAGQGAGQPGRVHVLVCGLTGIGVGGELRRDGPQQSDFGGDLGSEVGEGHGRMAGVELERSLGGGDPLAGPGLAQMVVRRFGDQHGEALQTGLDQHVRIGEAL
jgi:hypothetical protein